LKDKLALRKPLGTGEVNLRAQMKDARIGVRRWRGRALRTTSSATHVRRALSEIQIFRAPNHPIAKLLNPAPRAPLVALLADGQALHPQEGKTTATEGRRGGNAVDEKRGEA
jgi:hypothetical protein